MKRLLLYLLAYSAILTAASFLLWSCQAAPLEPLLRVVAGAAQDGVVSQEELLAIQAVLPPPAFDWAGTLQVIGSIAGSILGIKLLPNRALQGPFDPKHPA